MAGTQETAPLGTESNSGVTAGVAEQRINDLMSKWQTEQAQTQRLQGELSRLQGLLATAVTTEAELRQQITQAATGTDTKVTEAETRATAAESLVAELRGELAKLKAEQARLTYIVNNRDLIDYAAVLPSTEDTATLEAAATTIRNANQQFRQQFSPTSRVGSQTPRIGTPPAATPDDIAAYLRNSPPDQFEARLAEVQQRLRK